MTTTSNALTIDSKTRIRELDGIRGLAITFVLIWHYLNCQFAAKLGSFMAHLMWGTSLFWSGVDLFFVLSGLLIGGILIDHSDQKGFLPYFFVRRAVRILPVYFLLLGLYFVSRGFLRTESFEWLFENQLPDLAYLTFTQNVVMGMLGTFGGNFLGIKWSLAIEEQFYLALPLTLVLLGKTRLLALLFPLVFLALALRFAFPGFVSVVNMPFRMDPLLLGVGLAACFRNERFVRLLNKYQYLLWGLFVLTLSAMATMTFFNRGKGAIDLLVIAVFYTSFVALAVLYRGSSITYILRSKILVSAGFYSYGIYMYHQLVAGLLHGYYHGTPPMMDSRSGIGLTAMSLLITLILAVISYHGFEVFFLNLGRRRKYQSFFPISSSPAK